MKHKPNNILLIDWVDSCGETGWGDTESLVCDVIECQTIGFYVAENERGITLALNRADDDRVLAYDSIMTIPKVAITRIKRIK